MVWSSSAAGTPSSAGGARMISAILSYEFLQNAFLSGLIIGVIAPLLGLFIVVRRLALIADALSHVALAGIAGSLYLSQQVLFFSALNPVYLGIASAVGGSLLIEKLRGAYRHYEELAIPVILSAGIGLGAIFISLSKGFGSDLVGYLFGSVSAVSRQDLLVVLVIAIIVITYIRFFYKELFIVSFDPDYAKVSGINSKYIQMLFMIITALVIGASMRIVGILLVSSLMTIPVAAAIQLAKSFKGAMIYSHRVRRVSCSDWSYLGLLFGYCSRRDHCYDLGTYFTCSSRMEENTIDAHCTCGEGGDCMTLDEAWRILQENQFKRTKNRETILHFFSNKDRYMTALDVKNFMESENPGISFDTIYRNLNTFSELGILEETDLNGERHFECNVIWVSIIIISFVRIVARRVTFPIVQWR